MKIVICPDKFKGSMTSAEAVAIIESAIKVQLPFATISSFPMADGGEGSVEALTLSGGVFVKADSYDPLLRPIVSTYGIVGDKAIIEMSSSVGLMLIDKKERNPEKTSSYGFGVVIRDAIERGAKDIVLAIGGSATNDCGVGMLSALGVKFSGIETFNGENLINISGIELTEEFKSLIDGVRFTTASDVTNTLYGSGGATYTYAPQKGADMAMCDRLECGVKHFADKVLECCGIDLSSVVGAGAAGGVGAALYAFLWSNLVSGAEYIAKEVGLFEHIMSADLVITGEGKIDCQTLNNKLAAVVAKEAKKYGIPVIAICGIKSDDVSFEELEEIGITSLYELSDDNIEQSILEGRERLRECIEEIIIDEIIED